MRIGEYTEKKKESYFSWYLLAVVIGVALFFFSLLATKSLIFAAKFVIKHWILVSVGVVILILIKKLRRPKVVKEVVRNEYQYREV